MPGSAHPPYRPPCGGWRGKISLGHEMHYKASENGIPRYVNTTTVAVSPPCETGDPERPTPKPYPPGDGAQCVGGSPDRYPEPIPENTYAEATEPPLTVDLARCAKRGFKNVYARKSWHGSPPFNSSTRATPVSHFELVDGLPSAVNAITPFPPETTRYRTLRVAVDRYGVQYGSATFESVCTVDRYTGRLTGSRTESEGWGEYIGGGWGHEGDEEEIGRVAHAHPQSLVSAFFECVNEHIFPNHGTRVVFSVVNGGRKALAEWDYTLSNPELSATGFASVDLDAGLFEMEDRITFPPASDGHYGNSWSAAFAVVGSVTYEFKQYRLVIGGDELYSSVESSASLSDAYGGSDVMDDVETLFANYNLANDTQYPWREDLAWEWGPLVFFNERGPTAPIIWPSATWQDDSKPPRPSFGDGAIIGIPNPAGYEAFFDFYHSSAETGSWGAWITPPATAWINDAQADAIGITIVTPSAWVALNTLKKSDDELLDGPLVVWACKHAEVIAPCRKSWNFFRPCGADRDARICLEKDPETGECLEWGPYLFPDAWPICGRLAISHMELVEGQLIVTLAEPAPFLRTGDKVDFVSYGAAPDFPESVDNNGGGGYEVTVTDATHFEITAEELPEGTHIKSHGAPHYKWHDDQSKGQFVTLEETYGYHETEEGPAVGWQPAQCTQRCLVNTVCNPRVGAYTPNAEDWPNGENYWPGGLVLDYVNGLLWKGRIQQTMADTITAASNPEGDRPQLEAMCEPPEGAPDLPSESIMGPWPLFDEGGEDALWV